MVITKLIIEETEDTGSYYSICIHDDGNKQIIPINYEMFDYNILFDIELLHFYCREDGDKKYLLFEERFLNEISQHCKKLKELILHLEDYNNFNNLKSLQTIVSNNRELKSMYLLGLLFYEKTLPKLIGYTLNNQNINKIYISCYDNGIVMSDKINSVTPIFYWIFNGLRQLDDITLEGIYLNKNDESLKSLLQLMISRKEILKKLSIKDSGQEFSNNYFTLNFLGNLNQFRLTHFSIDGITINKTQEQILAKKLKQYIQNIKINKNSY